MLSFSQAISRQHKPSELYSTTHIEKSSSNRDISSKYRFNNLLNKMTSNYYAGNNKSQTPYQSIHNQFIPNPSNSLSITNRAIAVKTELMSPSSGLVSGIPGSFITIFAHGETTEFGSKDSNRRVTLSIPEPLLGMYVSPGIKDSFRICARYQLLLWLHQLLPKTVPLPALIAYIWSLAGS